MKAQHYVERNDPRAGDKLGPFNGDPCALRMICCADFITVIDRPTVGPMDHDVYIQCEHVEPIPEDYR